MPRSPSFDRRKKVEEALEVFREQGYEATSIQDLVDHLDLNRSSLYNTFGGKHDLYLEALDHCRQSEQRALCEHLRGAATAMEGLRRAFAAVTERVANDPCGCLTANATVECATSDPSTRERACETLDVMQTLFRETVERAQEEGTIDPARDAEALGYYLTNAYHGLYLTAKTGPSPDVLADIVDETLRGLRGAPAADPH
jgi:TetR/AcrR family transcriptional repressor of nem operon